MKRALLVALLLTGCHHEVKEETLRAPDPCTLITADEMQTAIGSQIREGTTGGDEATVHRCVWLEGGEGGAGAITIAIHVIDRAALMGQLRNIPHNERLSDLGDEAYWSDALNQLTMTTKSGIVTITFNSSGGARDHRIAAIEIAKILLPKLS
jgi:hypothetical protein